MQKEKAQEEQKNQQADYNYEFDYNYNPDFNPDEINPYAGGQGLPVQRNIPLVITTCTLNHPLTEHSGLV